MEFIGKTITKEFRGFGVFDGVIQSYDPSSGFYTVLYNDGDSEEVDFDEISRLLRSTSAIGSVIGGKRGRPKRRRRRIGQCKIGADLIENSLIGNNVVIDRDSDNVENNVNFVGNGDLGNSVNFVGNGDLMNCVDFVGNGDLERNVDDVGNGDLENNGNVVGGNGNLEDSVVGNGGGLDLNRGLEGEEGGESGSVRGCIDLNLSVEGVEHDGDVKVGPLSVEFGGDGVSEGKIGSLSVGGGEEGKKERGFDLNLGFNDAGVNGGSGSVGVEACVGVGEELRDKGGGGGVDGGNVGSRVCDGELERGGSGIVGCEDGNSGRRKRRKVEMKLGSPCGTVLRRSARRAKVAEVALCESVKPIVMVDDGVNEVSVSGITEDLEEKPVVRVVESKVPCSKIELPPSSAKLNLEGIPVADVFSVYSCLRSFSTLLYLSPFEMVEFVAALNNRVSNLLIDCIHISILQTLRKHLEFLANDGCESASTCLRNLNWDLLDVITWPVFMVEYLLIQGSALKPGYILSQLKLFDGGYYKLPAGVKIELLRCLCDDVIEVEAIRSELMRRKTRADANMEDKKKKISEDAPGDSCLDEDMEEVADGNSDECCLCKMDGNLICCDGCPAAYHSKCVGIVSSLLPEGDWYCPECVIGRDKSGSKPEKSTQGAELLGIDPVGRLFFSCFEYLLVSESYDADSSFSYYHKDDLGAVIQFLQSSNNLHGSILTTISQHWAMPADMNIQKCDLVSENSTLKDEDCVGRKIQSSMIPGYSGHLGIEGQSSDFFGLAPVKCCTETGNLLTSSEGSAEVLNSNGVIQNSDRPLSNVTARGTSAKRISAAKRRKKNSAARLNGSSCLKFKEEDISHGQPGDGYMNSYSFAYTAASVVKELLQKPSDKASVDMPKTEEEIISIQLKFILNNSTKFCWFTTQAKNAERQKEKCGWCYCCRFAVGDRDCLFNIKSSSSIPLALKAEIDGILPNRDKKGHLVDIICYMLCMEERLRGLLLGPWLSPRYSELWRKRVLKASDVSLLKHPLIVLESNLHPLAFLADWSKHVDFATTIGSASHFVASSRVTSKNGVNRKKIRCADIETKSSTAGSGLGLFWWRGGKTSRSLFNWKVIPRSLALKAARKAGCMTIPDIHYSDSPENARRSKYVAWRAAVEASTSLEQLALQVRDLNLSIRWDDIEHTHPHLVLDKESLKSMRLFKKVIIRRKCIKEAVAKYLLDFGKRRSIPEVVSKHGIKLEDSDGERKRYWLDESYVPLYLLKSYEEKRITRKAGKTKSGKICKGGRVMKKPSRGKGFDYLFTRAERADSYQCGHCNKNVPTSEAVSCQCCKGNFHKRHVMKSSEGITAGCTYTCHRCRAGKKVKNNSSQGKRKSGRLQHAKNLKVGSRGRPAILKAKPIKVGKTLSNHGRRPLRNDKKKHNHEQPVARRSTSVSAGITLRRSARKTKVATPQSDVYARGKKRKRIEPSSSALKKNSKSSKWKKMRTHICHSFWINGLHISRKPNDERVSKFRRKKLLAPSEVAAEIKIQPKCSLCSEQEFTSALVYIACDICGDWFHGEAFGLDKVNIEGLIGFKCHVCRERSTPICPFGDTSKGNGALVVDGRSEPEDAQVLPVGEATLMETDGLLEFQSSEDPPSLLDLTPQNSDGNLDHDMAPISDSELTVEKGSSVSKEAISDLAESQDGEVLLLDGNSVLEGNDIKLKESQ